MSGTCELMCPPSEIDNREKNHLLHVLECTEDTKRSKFPKADRSKVVKQFVRSTFGFEKQSRANLRTENALIRTVEYLINNVINLKSEKFNVIYDFINDRLRAVRQDMIIQEIDGSCKIAILETCVLFHLYAAYRLCDQPARIFDQHLNRKALNECLDSLLLEYDNGHHSHYSRRDLFESVYLILNLGVPNSFLRFQSLPTYLQKSSLIVDCRHVHKAFVVKNYYRVLRALRSLPLAVAICLLVHLPALHFQYFQTLNCAYYFKNSTFPLNKLTELFCPFESDFQYALQQTKSLCADTKFVIESNSLIRLDKKNKHLQPTEIKLRNWKFLDKRLSSNEKILDALLSYEH